jgi:Flp pilus assembly protein TadB
MTGTTIQKFGTQTEKGRVVLCFRNGDKHQQTGTSMYQEGMWCAAVLLFVVLFVAVCCAFVCCMLFVVLLFVLLLFVLLLFVLLLFVLLLFVSLTFYLGVIIHPTKIKTFDQVCIKKEGTAVMLTYSP